MKSVEVAHSRGGRTVIVEDVLFLLRKNKVCVLKLVGSHYNVVMVTSLFFVVVVFQDKLKILLQHLLLKDMANSVTSGVASTEGMEDIGE